MYNQSNYQTQQPSYGQTQGYNNDNTPMSVGDYFISMLLTGIPIVGIVLLFIWAFGGSTNINKSNWAKATLLLILIGIVLSFIFFIFGLALYNKKVDHL